MSEQLQADLFFARYNVVVHIAESFYKSGTQKLSPNLRGSVDFKLQQKFATFDDSSFEFPRRLKNSSAKSLDANSLLKTLNKSLILLFCNFSILLKTI